MNGKPEERVLLYSYFNGIYKENGTHDGMPRFVEQNKKTDKAFKSTIPSEFIYCNELQRWIMFHPNIYKTYSDAKKKVVRALARFETRSHSSCIHVSNTHYLFIYHRKNVIIGWSGLQKQNHLILPR